MKKHSYGKLISISWSWMVEVLFRPFSLKKWIMLGIIILLAGQMGSNFNINIGGGRDGLDELLDTIRKKASAAIVVPAPPKTLFKTPIAPANKEEISLHQDTTPIPDIIARLSQFLKEPKTVGKITLLIGPLALFIIFIIFLWIWIRANFSFVFIDSVVRNDASLRIPFHRNKPQGNSFFWWSIVYSFIVLLIFGAIISIPIIQLVNTGIFTSTPIDPAKILSITLPYVPLLIVAWILFLLIQIFVLDFILPIMYKKRIGILKGWGVFLGLLKKNIGEMLLYLLVKLGLFILALVAAILLMIIGVIAFIIIGGALALLGFLIYVVTPTPARGIVLFSLILIAIPTYVFLGFLFNLLFMPIPIFFRIFSIHVLISMDESLDVFAPKTEEQLMLEGDDEQYRKSMGLVWFAVLSPFLVVILGIALAIAIPNFIKMRPRTSPVKEMGIEDIIPIKEMKSIQDLTKRKSEPKGEPVTVYLKNGNTFEAELMTETENNVAFRIEGGTVVYPRSDILRIEKKQEE